MSLSIIKAGIFDTVQDRGRFGYRHIGISPGGAMDAYAAALANALLGKELHSPVIEMHFPASTILFQRPTIVCITGADFNFTLNGKAIPLQRPIYVPANTLLEGRQVHYGSWSYLSLIHDLMVEEWMGSYSTNTRIEAGGVAGRPLRKNDVIAFKNHLTLAPTLPHTITPLPWQANGINTYSGKEIRFIKGNEWNWLTAESAASFEKEWYQVSQQSDRMGYRLTGNPLAAKEQKQLISSAVTAGTIQLLPNGQLIVLMADHQTTGGYPRIGHVITANLPLLAQHKAGSQIGFRACDLVHAEQALIEQKKYLQQLQIACTFKMQNFVHATL